MALQGSCVRTGSSCRETVFLQMKERSVKEKSVRGESVFYLRSKLMNQRGDGSDARRLTWAVFEACFALQGPAHGLCPLHGPLRRPRPSGTSAVAGPDAGTLEPLLRTHRSDRSPPPFIHTVSRDFAAPLTAKKPGLSPSARIPAGLEKCLFSQ